MEELEVARQEDIRQGLFGLLQVSGCKEKLCASRNVEARAWAVSTPMPPEQPVMRIVWRKGHLRASHPR
jgi:hypothetical protein